MGETSQTLVMDAWKLPTTSSNSFKISGPGDIVFLLDLFQFENWQRTRPLPKTYYEMLIVIYCSCIAFPQ